MINIYYDSLDTMNPQTTHPFSSPGTNHPTRESLGFGAAFHAIEILRQRDPEATCGEIRRDAMATCYLPWEIMDFMVILW